MLCAHQNKSGAIDGQSVCLDCGRPLQEPDPRRDFLRAIDAIKRDFGVFGRHSMRCMLVNGEWCCADDCEVTRKSNRRT